MPDNSNPPTKTDSNVKRGPSTDEIKDSLSFAQTYYVHQYQRFSTLEQQQLNLSNIVMGVTTIAFTFGFSGVQGVNILNGVGLPILVITVNIFAILYYRQTSKFIRTHRKRAKRVLEAYGGYVFKIDQEERWSGRSPDWKFYSAIHVFMILVTLLPIAVFLQTLP